MNKINKINYDPNKLPKFTGQLPDLFSINWNDFVYIGIGDETNTFMDQYEKSPAYNKKRIIYGFDALLLPLKYKTIDLSSMNLITYNASGKSSNHHYFVRKNSFMLPVLAPLSHSQTQLNLPITQSQTQLPELPELLLSQDEITFLAKLTKYNPNQSNTSTQSTSTNNIVISSLSSIIDKLKNTNNTIDTNNTLLSIITSLENLLSLISNSTSSPRKIDIDL